MFDVRRAVISEAVRRVGAALLCATFVGMYVGAGLVPARASEDTVRDFWSAQRMRSAQGDSTGASHTTASPDGRGASEPSDELGAAWTGGGAIARTAGRLFFTLLGEDGSLEPSSCSANVVDSANESVIMTANHCAHGEDYLFVPGYRDGEAPFGGWTVQERFMPEGNQITSDFAAFTLNQLNGRTIQSVVGAQSISFDHAVSLDRLDLFGYPRERKNDPEHPYGGRELSFSSGAVLENPMGLIGVGTDMGRGVSGGAFLTDFDPDTGSGTQIAVVSGSPCVDIGDDGECHEVAMASYGALFDEVARNLYEQAARV